MKKFLKKALFALAIVLATVCMISPSVFAADGTEICDDLKSKNIDNYELICGKKNDENAQNVVASVLKLVFTWVGVIAVIVIIIGGVFYMTSQGDPGKIKRAKETILYAVIGLVVSLSAFAIVTFVVGATEGEHSPESYKIEKESEDKTP